MVMHRINTALTFTLVLTIGCSPKPGGDTDSASASEAADTGATIGHSSDPTGDDPVVLTLPTTDATTTGTSATSNVDTSATSDVDGVDASSGELPMPTACALMCQHAADCQLGDDPAGCAAVCESNLAGAAPECVAAAEAAAQCFACLSCEHLALALDGQFGHPCGPEQFDRNNACGGPDSCDSGGTGVLDGTSCELEVQCAGEPLRRMECDTEQCLCFEDGAQVDSCPADDACKGRESLDDKALSCCGFSASGA
jgi:hypothetical protein